MPHTSIKTSRQAMEYNKVLYNCRLFAEISVHQTPQGWFRLDMPVSLQHLNKVCVCIAKDNTLEATISVLVKEKLINNIKQFKFQFVMRNCGLISE